MCLNHLVQLFFSVFLGLCHWDCSQLNICFDWWWFEVPLSFSRILACLWFLVFSDSWFISVSPHYASTDHRAWCEAVPFSRFRIMILPTFRFYWVLGFLGLRSWLWATSLLFLLDLCFNDHSLQCGRALDWFISLFVFFYRAFIQRRVPGDLWEHVFFCFSTTEVILISSIRDVHSVQKKCIGLWGSLRSSGLRLV